MATGFREGKMQRFFERATQAKCAETTIGSAFLDALVARGTSRIVAGTRRIEKLESLVKS